MQAATYRTWELCYNRRCNPPPMRCSFGQLKSMCALMTRELPPGYSFVPEPSAEGGVQFTNWPGKQSAERAHKTFRFRDTKDYPWVDAATSDNAAFTMPTDGKHVFDVKLEAFHSAPAFTNAELTAFRKAFEDTVRPTDGWCFFAMISATIAKE